MNVQVKELLGHGECKRNPTCANVVEAEHLCNEAKRIIDTDLNWQDRINSKDWMSYVLIDDTSVDKYFGEEIKLLKSEKVFWMLPMCFYLALDGSKPL